MQENNPQRKTAILEKLGLDTKERRAWAYYDIANSGFAAVVMVAILPIYFADVVASDLPAHERSSLWATIATVAMILTAILSPFLGNISDCIAGKKKFLFITTVTGAISCMALAFCRQRPHRFYCTRLCDCEHVFCLRQCVL